MRFKIIVLTGLAGLLMFAPMAVAAGPCCDDKACCKEMAAGCKDQGTIKGGSILVPQIEGGSILIPQIEPVTEISRQVAVVWFMRPVLIGDRIVQGKYIIEHDNVRMAAGLPCTHIYAASDRRMPVVAFHCTHLERPRVDKDTVVLHSTGDASGLQKFVSFQFSGEAAAHGVPAVR